MYDEIKTKATELWQNPLARSAGLGLGGAVVGHVGANALGSMLVNLLFATKPTAERQAILRDMRNSGRHKILGSMLGALAGVVLAQGGNADTRSWDGFKKSVTQKDYWDEGKVNALMKERKGQTSFIDDLLLKGASDYNSFNIRSIPVTRSVNLISNDNYLRDKEKDTINNILLSSNNYKSGIVSKRGIMDTAIKAGVAYIPAYMLGSVTGTLLGLPEPLTTRLSTIGGIAASIKRTGIFS
jgi:hypothetical protein